MKKQRHHFANKRLSSQSYGFSSSHVQIWELNHKEYWAPKNWCFWIMVLEKTLESPLDCKEIRPVNPEGNNSKYSLERLMLKLKLQYFGHLMRQANSLEKTLMLGKTEGKRRRGWQRMRWLLHHRLKGHEFEQTLRDSHMEAWYPAVHGVANSQTWLSHWTTTKNHIATC